MNHGVAIDAWCQRGRSRTHSVNCRGSNLTVALIAQRVDVRHIQQTRVLRPMRRVASHTSLGLDRSVLKHKGATRLGVALGADRILIGRGLQVVVPKGPVWIMAVRAAHSALVHLVVERHIKRRFRVGMALEAQCGLRSLQQMFAILGLMDAMAARATDACLGMRRTIVVRMRSCMTTQAPLAPLFCCGFIEIEDLGFIAAALDVRATRSVAALAGCAILAMGQSQLGVRIR